MYSLSLLEESDKTDKTNDCRKEKVEENSIDYHGNVSPYVRQTHRDGSEPTDILLNENNDEVSLMSASKRKRLHNFVSEITPRNVQIRNFQDAEMLISPLKAQANKDHYKKQSLLKVSSEKAESDCRSKNEIQGAHETTSVNVSSVYQQVNLSPNAFNLIPKKSYVDCRSTKDSKRQFSGDNNMLFMDSLECVQTNDLSKNKHILLNKNPQAMVNFSPRNETMEDGTNETLEELRENPSAHEVSPEVSSKWDKRYTNKKEPVFCIKDDNDVAGPSGIRLRKKKHHCDICSKQFETKLKLEEHYRIHTGERPLGCHLCKKSFAHKYSLQIHMGTHTGERPFKCPNCEKAFIEGSNLKTHIRIHTGERPYKCPACEMSFNTSYNRKTHYKKKHE